VLCERRELLFNNLEVCQITSVGDREINQDCMAYTLSAEYALFVVADGLGGHKFGEKASKFFCQGMFKLAAQYQKLLQQGTEEQAKKVLATWISAAVDEMKVLFKGAKEGLDSHTTCAVLYLDKNYTLTAHCGDSRIYRLNEKEVLWRTKDHSLIQDQLNNGVISEHDMGLHPEQNQLLRTINILKQYQAEINSYPPIKKGETFLLCTDGFWEFLKERDLLQLSTPQSGKDELRKTAKMMHLRAKGRGDNLTVQWLRLL